ncbi:cell wall protein DAN4-like [Echeneis naucrates]|uniref:cell wall protein DAN4-like n=1 Tax=Echeneis naucrates TaxID=173247 RepID=UPI00111403A9|nr:cell wall protein DAN4-like [Echeneis naucrates]
MPVNVSATLISPDQVQLHKVMDCFSLSFLLLLVLPLLNDAQNTITQPAGCAGPPVLCCPGKNNSCSRNGCFCDQFCLNNTDCCPDYISTCISSTPENSTASSGPADSRPSASVSVPTASSTTDGSAISTVANVTTSSAATVSNTATPNTTNSSTSALPDVNTTPASTAVSATVTVSTRSTTSSTGTTPTGTSTTLDTHSGVTSSPADGSTPGVTNTMTHPQTTAHTGEDYQVVSIHLKVTVLSSNEENKDVISNAVSNFLSQAFLKKNCNGCTFTIKRIKSI